jgi:hypothetical protein
MAGPLSNAIKPLKLSFLRITLFAARFSWPNILCNEPFDNIFK